MEKYCKDKKNVLIGTKGCDLIALGLAAVIFTPRKFSAAQQSALGADLFSGVKSLIYGDIATKTAGCPIVYDITMTPTDNSEGAVLGTYGAGNEQYIRGGNMKYMIDLPQRFCKAKKMMMLNNWDGGVIFLTKDNRVIFGSENNGEYQPFQLVTNYVAPKMFEDGQNATLIQMYINLGDVDTVFPKIFVSEKLADIDAMDKDGIIGGTLTDLAIDEDKEVITFGVVDSCTGADIADATYSVSGTLTATVLVDGVAKTGTVSNGVVTVTLTTPLTAGTYDIEVVSGVSSDASVDADNDITFYTASGKLVVA